VAVEQIRELLARPLLLLISLLLRVNELLILAQSGL
jgi:hypothetical protein